jgi:hypothetical protein
MLLSGTNTFAATPQKPCIACLNKVNLQLTAEDWISTNTARVLVSINAAGNTANLTTLHDRIMQKLSILSNSNKWHITTFQRSQDKAGLERVYAIAEIRLPETALKTLQTKIKNISRPGETYKVESIIFQPDLQETQQTITKLHAKLYKIANAELTQLNKSYPKQHYYLHNLTFVPTTPPAPANAMILAKFARNGAGDAAAPLTVSNKVILRADVVFASAPPTTD